MAAQDFDVVVIGGGPGGYVAAIRAAQLGLKTACVEKRGSLGGTCLNVGCIPSKALLQSSHHFEEVSHRFAEHGIKVGSVELDLATMMARKQKVVGDNTKGIEFLFKKHKITYLIGAGRIAAPGKVEVAGKDGVQTVTARHIVIATGSEVTPLPGVAIDEDRIVSSTGALELRKVPGHLVVIGAGVIGLELGSVWRRLGAEVTVVEFLDRALPLHDGEISKQMQRILERQGMKFKLGTKVMGADIDKTGVTLTLEPAKGGAKETLSADVVLVAIGRRPHTEGLGAREAGVEIDGRGFIKVDSHFQTSVPGISAIGDVIGGVMLAHKAEEEGVALAEILAGQAGHVNYDAIPGVVYTWPEVANVGKTEEQLKAEGIAYRVGKFPFTANGRARANGDIDGFVKILADAKTDKVLGCHIIGPAAGDLIAEVVLGMEFSAAAEDIARTSHAHPSLAEAVKEAALAVDGRPIHI
ncbi:dihydrolipoyl dehydrogenase [Telmatospirillum sp.]|uniref:dihydrolipoyl dehydrogenase n=1 Tax=Telmatospirillum sp. TaxID=2079197 RepID=UPI00284145A6|nr:dihydrolipoyl dehydrogenase [Telmatospirillum sp.]MDR3441091.1 dihydrolipoyl dehydrogenase [Telmatospirillum sp.]